MASEGIEVAVIKSRDPKVNERMMNTLDKLMEDNQDNSITILEYPDHYRSVGDYAPAEFVKPRKRVFGYKGNYRNEQCLCGSGKKYKKCCMDKILE